MKKINSTTDERTLEARFLTARAQPWELICIGLGYMPPATEGEYRALLAHFPEVAAKDLAYEQGVSLTKARLMAILTGDRSLVERENIAQMLEGMDGGTKFAAAVRARGSDSGKRSERDRQCGCGQRAA